MIPIKLLLIVTLIAFSYQKICSLQGKIVECECESSNETKVNNQYKESEVSYNNNQIILNKNKRLNRKEHLDLAIKETVKAFGRVSKNMMNEAANVAKSFAEEIKHSIQNAVKEVTDQAIIVLSTMKGEPIQTLPIKNNATHIEEEIKPSKQMPKQRKKENLRFEPLLFIEKEDMFTVEDNNN